MEKKAGACAPKLFGSSPTYVFQLGVFAHFTLAWSQTLTSLHKDFIPFYEWARLTHHRVRFGKEERTPLPQVRAEVLHFLVIGVAAVTTQQCAVQF